MQNISKKTLKSIVVEARQSFQFFRQLTWFFRNNRALPKFRYHIFHYLVSIIRFKKNQSIKANCISTREPPQFDYDWGWE